MFRGLCFISARMLSLVDCVNDQKLVLGRSLPVVMLERNGAGANDFAAPAAEIGI